MPLLEPCVGNNLPRASDILHQFTGQRGQGKRILEECNCLTHGIPSPSLSCGKPRFLLHVCMHVCMYVCTYMHVCAYMYMSTKERKRVI